MTARDDAYDAALRELQLAVTAQRSGSHLPRLIALRQLADPASAPLFRELVGHSEWPVQVHAVLALAELSASRTIDETLTAGLGQQAQEAVTANAIDLKLIEPGQMQRLIAAGTLSPMPHLLLAGELLLRDIAIDPAPLRGWVESENLRQACLSAALLARRGEAGVLDQVSERLDALDPDRRLEHRLLLVEMIRQYRVKAGMDLLAAIVAGDEHRELTYRSVLAMLEIDQDRGLAAWRDQVGLSPEPRDAVRWGLLLAACDAAVPPAEFDRLAGVDDELTRAIVRVGRARTGSGDLAAASINLLVLDHRRSVDWAVRSLDDGDPEVARAVYGFLIDRLADERPDSPTHIELAVRASAALGRLDVEAVLSRLRAADDDGTMQQAIMLGLFDVPDPRVGEAAGQLRRIGAGRADSLALLLMAKHLPALAPEDLETLGLIASGGSTVADTLRVQASWLYLKHAGRLDDALRTIVPGD